jgi:L-lactate dehydrogenase
MDIVQGTAFRDPVDVVSGDYEDAKDSDIVIITSGVPRKPGQTRIELAQTNVNIIKDIAPKIAAEAPNALYIIVSNPVDVMTYAFLKASGLPENQIIGSGTLLDTTRLRYGIASHFKIAQKNIHAYVFGEHGDSSFVPWSCSSVAGVPMDEFTAISNKYGNHLEEFDEERLEEYVHKSGGEIIKRKGATFYGVSMAVVNLCSMLLSAYESVVTVSSMMHGEYGVSDVCTSCLTIVGPDGVKGKLEVKLTDEEVEKFRKSADALKAVIAQLDI